MPIFRIRASETIYYSTRVEAETEDEAVRIFYDTETDGLDPVDTDGIEINSIEEVISNP